MFGSARILATDRYPAGCARLEKPSNRYASLLLPPLLLFLLLIVGATNVDYQRVLCFDRKEERIASHIRCYQNSSVTIEHFDSTGSRRKRSSDFPVGGAKVELRFTAYGVAFDVSLHNHDLFHERARLVLHDNLGKRDLPLDYSELLQGHIKGDPRSVAHGRVTKYAFDGVVSTENETYFIEPSSKYTGTTLDHSSHLNSVVYRLSDVEDDLFSNVSGRCFGVRAASGSHGPHSADEGDRWHVLRRRAATAASTIVTPSGTSKLPRARHCALSLHADHRFFSFVGGGNVATTIAEMAHHVAEADRIFRSTAWDGGQNGNNIGFVIARITIYQSESSDPMRAVADGSSAQSYLDAFSAVDHTQFCSAIAFTYVDFVSGVLGLAWIGTSSSQLAGGGICQKPFTLKDKVVFYNSAIASMKNFGARVSRPMYSVTVTHELAHNFGAEHDSVDTYLCAPGGVAGNYIMFPVSGDGSKGNNYLFSMCTINSVYPVLLARMSVCFLDSIEKYCGNAVVEGSELCDCGSTSTCGEVDPCCSVWSPNATSNCRLRSSAACSPRVSPCCTADCRIAAAGAAALCRTATECSEASHCTGSSADCPESVHMPDGTPCSGGSRVCERGECIKTLCEYKGLQQCFCSGQEYACDVCCRANASSTCESASKLGIAGSTSVKIPLNGLCDDGRGMCDIHGTCVPVFGGLALVDIGQLLQDSATDFVSTFKNYWYYMVIGVCALIAATAIFVVLRKRAKPVHAIAYKDGKMARVWFESRMRLASLNKEIASLAASNPYVALPPPVAAARISYQFPTIDEKRYYEVAPRCQTEIDFVKRLLVAGYPMRVLLQPRKWQSAEVASWVGSMFRKDAQKNS